MIPSEKFIFTILLRTLFKIQLLFFASLLLSDVWNLSVLLLIRKNPHQKLAGVHSENQINLSLLFISCIKRTKEVQNIVKSEVLETIVDFIYHTLLSFSMTKLGFILMLVV